MAQGKAFPTTEDMFAPFCRVTTDSVLYRMPDTLQSRFIIDLFAITGFQMPLGATTTHVRLR